MARIHTRDDRLWAWPPTGTCPSCRLPVGEHRRNEQGDYQCGRMLLHPAR